MVSGGGLVWKKIVIRGRDWGFREISVFFYVFCFLKSNTVFIFVELYFFFFIIDFVVSF